MFLSSIVLKAQQGSNTKDSASCQGHIVFKAPFFGILRYASMNELPV